LCFTLLLTYLNCSQQCEDLRVIDHYFTDTSPNCLVLLDDQMCAKSEPSLDCQGLVHRLIGVNDSLRLNLAWDLFFNHHAHQSHLMNSAREAFLLTKVLLNQTFMYLENYSISVFQNQWHFYYCDFTRLVKSIECFSIVFLRDLTR